MSGLACQRDGVALDADGAGDDAERKIELLEHGSLLDVELHVGACAGHALPCPRCALQLHAELTGDVCESETLPVDSISDGRRIQSSGDRRRAVHALPAEADALLVCPVHEL